MRRKIIFAVPTNTAIEPATVLSIAAICQRDDVEYHAVTGSPTDQVRNGLAKTALADPECTHLLMMDSDIVPPDNIVDLLLECDWPMAAAIVPICIFGKIVTNIVTGNHFMEYWGDKPEPFEADGAGTGCVLIRREVFETVPWPWFRYIETPEGKRKGEDIFFSKKARDHGFTYKVHPRSASGHIKKINLMDIVHAFNSYRKDLTNENRNIETGLPRQERDSVLAGAVGDV